MNKLLPILLVVVLSGCGSNSSETFYATCDFEAGTSPVGGYTPKLRIEYSLGFFNNKLFVGGFEATDVQTDTSFAKGKFVNEDGTSHKLMYQRGANTLHIEDLDKNGSTTYISRYKCGNEYIKQPDIRHPKATSLEWGRGYNLGYFNQLTSSQLLNQSIAFKNGYLYGSAESSCHNYLIVGHWSEFDRKNCKSFFSTSKYLHGKEGIISPNAVSCSDKVWSNCLGYTSEYYGKFKNNRPHGFGRYKIKNNVIVGSINNGMLHGKVVEEFDDGTIREGTWVDGRLEGEAIVKYGSTSEIYVYKNGKLISKKSKTNKSNNSQESFRTMFQLLDLLNRAYY